jgi:hypothetical protein
MNKALSLLCLLLVCLALVGVLPQCLAEENPPEPHRPSVILLTPENISRPLESLKIPLTMLNTENASRGYPPGCSLFLHEARPDKFRFTLRVVTTALFWQSENVEAWLTVNDQATVKLDRSVFDKKTGVALVGAIFTSEYDYSLSGLGEGCHILKIRVLSPPDYEMSLPGYNESNIQDLFYYEGSVLYRIDTTTPIIRDISIKDSVYFTNDLELNCTIDEPFSWVAYSIDNQANVTITTNPQTDYSLDSISNKATQVYTNLTDLTEGVHILTIYANDTAGNMGASQTISFTVAASVPAIAVVAVSAAVAIVVFLLVIKRRRRIIQ